jgi:hypothetical protein
MKHQQIAGTLKLVILLGLVVVLVKILILSQSDTQADYKVVFTRERIPRHESESALSTVDDKSLR